MDDQTIRLYDTRAQDYRKAVAKDDDALLTAFIEAISPGGRVLDLGCGPGHGAAHMAKAGLNVDAVDASASMVALARQHPGVQAWQATFNDLTDQSVYDGIWANFSLLHARRDDLPTHLNAIHTALKPDGRFTMSVKAGTGERRDDLGRYYSYYTQEELTTLLQAAGFKVAKIATGRGKGLDGAMADWISVTSYE